MDAQFLSKPVKVIYFTLAFLVAVIALFVLFSFGVLGIAFIWPVVGLLFGLILYLLFPSTSLPTLFRLLKPLFPAINELIAKQEQLSLNSLVVAKMRYVLKELYSLDIMDNEVQEELTRSLPAVNTESDRITNCAENIARRLKSSRPHLSGRLLQLLYQENYDLSAAKIVWSQDKDKLIPGLARVLLEGNCLPIWQGLSYNERDTASILDRLDTFTLKDFKASVEVVSVVWSHIIGYFNFLEENGILHKNNPPDAGETLALIESQGPLPDSGAVQEMTLKVLIAAGEKAIGDAFPKGTDKLQTSLCLISLILFFLRNPNLPGNFDLIANICRRAAILKEAVRIVFAYLEFNEDLLIEEKLGGKEFVSVRYLMQNWKKKVKEKESTLGKGFPKELHTIQATLGQGQWPTKLSHSLEQTYLNILEESRSREPLHVLLTERPWLIEALKRVFKNLTLPTVERYLEARTVNAYILTFMSEEGTVSGLLNCFTAPDKETELEKLGVKLRVESQLKYNFKQYTDQARIGVVPKGWSFEQFHKEFQKDFLKVIKARRELLPVPSIKRRRSKGEWDWDEHDLKNIELIIHRFGLSGRNYYGFVSAMSREYAIEKVKDLFAGILSPDDLLALIEYEDRVKLTEALVQGPIMELIGSQTALPDAVKSLIENRDQTLRGEILLALGFNRIQELGQCFLESGDQKRKDIIIKAGETLSSLLTESFPDVESDMYYSIAGAYIETLGAISSINA